MNSCRKSETIFHPKYQQSLKVDLLVLAVVGLLAGGEGFDEAEELHELAGGRFPNIRRALPRPS